MGAATSGIRLFLPLRPATPADLSLGSLSVELSAELVGEASTWGSTA